MIEKRTDTYKTLITISTGFLIIYLITKWNWAIIVSLIIGIIGILSPFLSKKIEWFWIKLAYILSLIFPKIILGLVFYLFLFPLSLLYRIFNKDNLMLSSKYNSYFSDIKKQPDKKNFEKPW
jgi:hypothetical protein